MDLLITLVVFITAFMVFGSLFFGISRAFSGKRSGEDFGEIGRTKSNVRVNKHHNIYSFK